jgi:hypothetical protein
MGILRNSRNRGEDADRKDKRYGEEKKVTIADPGMKNRYFERRQENDGDRDSSYRGGDEYVRSSRYRESRESYPGSESGRPSAGGISPKPEAV